MGDAGCLSVLAALHDNTWHEDAFNFSYASVFARVTDICMVVRGTQSGTTVDLKLGHGRSRKSVERQAAKSHRAQLALSILRAIDSPLLLAFIVH